MSQDHVFFQNQIQSGGRLTDAEQAALEEHLASCAECRAYAAFHTQLSRSLPAVYPPVRHSDREIRAQAGAVQARLEKRRWQQRLVHNGLSLAGAAAALMLLLTVFHLLPRWMPGALSPEPAALSRVGNAAGQTPSAVTTATPAAQLSDREEQRIPTSAPDWVNTAPVVVAPGIEATPIPSMEAERPVDAPSEAAGAEAAGAEAAAAEAAGAGAATAVPAAAEAAVSAVIRGVALDGTMAFIGVGSRLAAVDLRQNTAPVLAAQSAELPGTALKVIPLPHQPTQRVVVSAGRYLSVLETAAQGEMPLITQSKLPGPINALILDVTTNRLYAGGALKDDATQGFVSSLAVQPDTLQLLDTVQLNAPVQSLALAQAPLLSLSPAQGGMAAGNPDQAAAPNTATLTLIQPVLYVAQNGVRDQNTVPDQNGVQNQNGAQTQVSAVPVEDEQFGAPEAALTLGQPVYSMTAAGDTLYLGADHSILAYRIRETARLEPAWQIESGEDIRLPGAVLGFELRANAIYVAGLRPDGSPFRQVVQPPEAINASSTVYTASCVAAANGQMLVAGEVLEIYNTLSAGTLTLLGTYPAR
jgi:hypothetical protein